MYKREIEEIEEVIKKHSIIHEKYICDICGKEFKKGRENEWHTGGCLQVGAGQEELGGNSIRLYDDDNDANCNFGIDGGYVSSSCYDICGECIRKKIFPYIKNLTNLEPRDTSEDW